MAKDTRGSVNGREASDRLLKSPGSQTCIVSITVTHVVNRTELLAGELETGAPEAHAALK